MPDHLHSKLGRRESQIMDVVYQKGEATAEEIRQALPDPPSNSSVRSMLRLLEKKEYLTHRREGRRYVYRPTVPEEKARRSAMKHLLKTFFKGSLPEAVATLLSVHRSELTEEELEDLSRMIEEEKDEDS